MGVWIETKIWKMTNYLLMVTPFVGVWIETCQNQLAIVKHRQSHPSWVCGLKLSENFEFFRLHYVTPFVGVWIETHYENCTSFEYRVTPFVGVWIETREEYLYLQTILSHPSWVCGLKLSYSEGLLAPR